MYISHHFKLIDPTEEETVFLSHGGHPILK